MVATRKSRPYQATVPLSDKGKGRAESPAICQIRNSPVPDGVKLLRRGGDCRRAGVLACIGGKIRPGRETQCNCTGDYEDDSHLMSPLTSFGFVSVKLGLFDRTFCVQDHKKFDFGIASPEPASPRRWPRFCPRNGRIPIVLVLIKPTLNP